MIIPQSITQIKAIMLLTQIWKVAGYQFYLNIHLNIGFLKVKIRFRILNLLLGPRIVNFKLPLLSIRNIKTRMTHDNKIIPAFFINMIGDTISNE